MDNQMVDVAEIITVFIFGYFFCFVMALLSIAFVQGFDTNSAELWTLGVFCWAGIFSFVLLVVLVYYLSKYKIVRRE